jgi:hypothetical protein
VKNHPSASAHASDHPEDVELFCLELDHQIQTAIRPALKAELDRRQRVFDATLKCLAKCVPNHGRTQRWTTGRNRTPHKRKRRRKNRSRHGTAKPAFVRDLAARLAKRWQAPLIIDPRLKSAG